MNDNKDNKKPQLSESDIKKIKEDKLKKVSKNVILRK